MDDKAAEENDSNPMIAEIRTTNQTAFIGVCVYRLTFFNQRAAGSPLSLAKAKVTREASMPCVTPFIHCPECEMGPYDGEESYLY
jgi:hypothetical protein